MNLPKISSRHKLIKFERMQLLLTIHIATPNSPLSIQKKQEKQNVISWLVLNVLVGVTNATVDALLNKVAW